MNTGHEKLKCEYCHHESEGTLRQKIQANVQYLLGNRQTLVTTGFKRIDNKACMQCHDRPRDNHPVYRFNEPRFSKARKELQPHLCNTCHLEHTGKRVTQTLEYCKHCHGKLTLKRDKIMPDHKSLVNDKKWATCLGCHDFHGNHKMRVNTDSEKVISSDLIKEYFQGGKSPYSALKKYQARKTP